MNRFFHQLQKRLDSTILTRMSNEGPAKGKTRSANAAIKGYIYQFDKTIIELLSADDDVVITVEGVEDFDLTSFGSYEAVQCKYLEAQAFSLPLIRDPVIAMLADSIKHSDRKYRLYIYCGDLSKFTTNLHLETLKQCLTKKPNTGPPLHLFSEYSDQQLNSFATRLILQAGKSYVQQNQDVMTVLTRVLSCTIEDCHDLFYPRSLNVVSHTAIQSEPSKRAISQKTFISQINRRHCMYTRWHAEEVGQNRFVAAIVRQVKAVRAVANIKERLLAIDCTSPQDSVRIAVRLGKDTYGPGCLRNAKPWTIVVDGDESQVIEFKQALLNDKVVINDGYEHILFQASQFDESPVVNTKPRSKLICRASYTLRVISYRTYVAEQYRLRRPDHVFSLTAQAIPGFEDRAFYLTRLPVDRVLEVIGV